MLKTYNFMLQLVALHCITATIAHILGKFFGSCQSSSFRQLRGLCGGSGNIRFGGNPNQFLLRFSASGQGTSTRGTSRGWSCCLNATFENS